MHFPIIVIENIETDKSLFRKNLPEDTTLESATDYYGEIFNKKRRKEILLSSWLEDIFDGIADIDTEKEIITFRDEDTIKATIKEYFINLTDNLSIDAMKGELEIYRLKEAASDYKNYSTMFFFNGCGWTSFEFVCEAKYYANQTFKIGNVFDAHC